MERIRIEQHGSLGLIWAGGWLFTVGYLKRTFWWGVLALVIWPYSSARRSRRDRCCPLMRRRPAVATDVPLLQRWSAQPHIDP